MTKARELRALRHIASWLDNLGIPPTRQELADAMGLSSKSIAQRLIDGLVITGYLRRLAGRDRAIELIPPRVRYYRFNDETKRLEPLR
jgi:SOS-response transcriptional repressor LexA